MMQGGRGFIFKLGGLSRGESWRCSGRPVLMSSRFVPGLGEVLLIGMHSHRNELAKSGYAYS